MTGHWRGQITCKEVDEFTRGPRRKDIFSSKNTILFDGLVAAGSARSGAQDFIKWA
jgi:hypothetical protein